MTGRERGRPRLRERAAAVRDDSVVRGGGWGDAQKGLSPRNRIDTEPGGRRVIFYISRALVRRGGTAVGRQRRRRRGGKRGRDRRGEKKPVDRITHTHTHIKTLYSARYYCTDGAYKCINAAHVVYDRRYCPRRSWPSWPSSSPLSYTDTRYMRTAAAMNTRSRIGWRRRLTAVRAGDGGCGGGRGGCACTRDKPVTI